ncbi:senescence-associated protein-domain-containing protein [Papiliotrema laurentii]|uniref:Senescence-associated protein-domain-containing protein n=1 Tax=Papiliotrema laurentii TaxID=5418 RepID=A0AAD9L8F7_PAPLA|nr:senescence-associated protein-domain-containing protein [Papiliotrema laurentii]
MSSLVQIPACTALHLPTPTSSPLPLSSGDLTLTVIPANPPTHPSPTLTLTIGSSSFPLLPNSPLQKIQTTHEHPSYIFSPLPADGGEPIGQVKIVLKDSKSPGEWEATEALAARFEAALKEHKVWDEKVLFVNDEYEATPGAPAKGWGEIVAGGVIGAGSALASRLSAFTDKHIHTTHPTHPTPPSDQVISNAAVANARTAGIAEQAEQAAQRFGEAIHEGGQKVGAQLPDSIARPATQPAEGDKSDFRKLAEEGWTQVSIAAKGIASATVTVAGSVSENAHRAVEHNFGRQADKVAQDIGQTGANIGQTALAAGTATSVVVQGANAGSGIAAAKTSPEESK